MVTPNIGLADRLRGRGGDGHGLRVRRGRHTTVPRRSRKNKAGP